MLYAGALPASTILYSTSKDFAAPSITLFTFFLKASFTASFSPLVSIYIIAFPGTTFLPEPAFSTPTFNLVIPEANWVNV